MNTQFNCPCCHAAVESDARQAGMQGECPACGGALVVPEAAVPVPKAVRKKNAREIATNLAADAVCGAAKLTWKAIKFAVPVALTVGERATKAVVKVAAPVVKDVLSGPVKPPSGFGVYMLIRWFMR